MTLNDNISTKANIDTIDSGNEKISKKIEKELKLLKHDKEMLKMYQSDYENNTVNGLIKMKSFNNNFYGILFGAGAGIIGAMLKPLNPVKPVRPMLLLTVGVSLGIAAGLGASSYINKKQKDNFNNPENKTRITYFNDLPKVIKRLEMTIAWRKRYINDLKKLSNKDKMTS